MKELIERWKAEMPVFWQNVLAFAIVIGGSALAVKTGDATLNLNMPAIIITICNYIIAVCCALGLSAKLTKL